MSDDLISRKEALEILFQYGELSGDVWEPYADIKNLPIAYDVDTVCDKLEGYLFEKYCIEGDAKIDKIVRNGGNKRWADEK